MRGETATAHPMRGSPGAADAAGGVEEEEAAGGAGDRGVEPAVEVEAQVCFGGYVAHVDKHRVPLAALGLVAGDGIGVLDLQGVEVRAVAQCLALV